MHPGSKRSLPNCHAPAIRNSTFTRLAHSGMVVLTSVAWCCQPTSFTATASIAAPVSA